jgi:hypothetical protein
MAGSSATRQLKTIFSHDDEIIITRSSATRIKADHTAAQQKRQSQALENAPQ